MTIWIFLWLVLSFVLLFFTGWTFFILYRQKQAWKRFASKHNLEYKGGSFNESPKIKGEYKGYSVELFTGEHEQEDGRQNRKLTAIEVELHSSLPMQGAVGSGGMIEIIRNLDYPHKVGVDEEAWGKSVLVRTDEPVVFQKYLDDSRLKGLSELMKVVNGWVIFIFVRNRSLLRIDIPNPLEDPKKMSVLLDKMVQVAKALELEKGERRTLEAYQGRDPDAEEAVSQAFDSKGDSKTIFELEEEESHSAEEKQDEKVSSSE